MVKKSTRLNDRLIQNDSFIWIRLSHRLLGDYESNLVQEGWPVWFLYLYRQAGRSGEQWEEETWQWTHGRPGGLSSAARRLCHTHVGARKEEGNLKCCAKKLWSSLYAFLQRWGNTEHYKSSWKQTINIQYTLTTVEIFVLNESLGSKL